MFSKNFTYFQCLNDWGKGKEIDLRKMFSSILGQQYGCSEDRNKNQEKTIMVKTFAKITFTQIVVHCK